MKAIESGLDFIQVLERFDNRIFAIFAIFDGLWKEKKYYKLIISVSLVKICYDDDFTPIGSGLTYIFVLLYSMEVGKSNFGKFCFFRKKLCAFDVYRQLDHIFCLEKIEYTLGKILN